MIGLMDAEVTSVCPIPHPGMGKHSLNEMETLKKNHPTRVLKTAM